MARKNKPLFPAGLSNEQQRDLWRDKWLREFMSHATVAESYADAGWCERAISAYGSAVGAVAQRGDVDGEHARRLRDLPGRIARGCRRAGAR